MKTNPMETGTPMSPEKQKVYLLLGFIEGSWQLVMDSKDRNAQYALLKKLKAELYGKKVDEIIGPTDYKIIEKETVWGSK